VTAPNPQQPQSWDELKQEALRYKHVHMQPRPVDADLLLTLITELEALRQPPSSLAPAGGWVATEDRLPTKLEPVWFVAHGKPTIVHKGQMGADDFVNDSLHCWRKHEVAWWKPRFVEPLPAPPEGA